ncbi:insulinase family protein [Porphyromonas uenonis]|nr:insulinase family protein [Porphyromonas uenonis]
MAEIERIRQYGFTQGEYERARTGLLKAFENSYNERETRKNSAYANEYKDYFTTGGYIPGIEMEKAIMEQVAKNIPLDVVNQMVQSLIGDKNMVLMLTAPDKKGLALPTEAELITKVNEYRKLPVEPIKDAVSDMKLMEKAPKAGKVTKREDNLKFGTTRLTLSNGMVVYLKTTDYKKNQISLTAVAPGGTNAYLKNAKDLPNIKNLSSVVALGGVGKFDNPTLTKALTGRSVSASGSMGGTRTYFSGISTLEDMETFFQLLYLRMTQPRQDADAFTNWRTNTIEQIKNMESNPMVPFQDSLIYALYNNDPQMRRATIAEIEAVDYGRVMQIWKERIADLGDLQLYFIGNVTPEQLIPYLEKYVASVPTKGRKHDMCKELVPAVRQGSMRIDFKKELATPMAMVIAAYTGKLPYTLHNDLAMEVLGGVMDQVYTATVREDEGGTYGVSSGGSISDNPEGETVFQIFYQTDPEKVDRLNKIIYAELDKVAKNGPNKEMFDKTILNMKKDYAENLKKNGYWLDHMVDFFFDGRDFQTDYEKTLNGITPADVQKIAQEILKQDNHIEVIIRDAKKAK